MAGQPDQQARADADKKGSVGVNPEDRRPDEERSVPPPTPVTTAKKRKVTIVWRFSAASSAPDTANTAIPK